MAPEETPTRKSADINDTANAAGGQVSANDMCAEKQAFNQKVATADLIGRGLATLAGLNHAQDLTELTKKYIGLLLSL